MFETTMYMYIIVYVVHLRLVRIYILYSKYTMDIEYIEDNVIYVLLNIWSKVWSQYQI